MTDIKIVTFKKDWRGYAVGETAGFDPAAADALIESGRAKLYVEKAAEKVGKAPAPKKAAGKAPAAEAPGAQQQDEQPPEQLEQEGPQQEQQENEDRDEKP